MSSSLDPARRTRLATLLALWMSLTVGVSAASAQKVGPDLWSIQLSGGMFAPIEALSASPSAGMRYGKHYGTHMQAGLLTGWTLKRSKVEAPSGSPESLEATVTLSQVDANLVPLMGFIQVDLTDRIFVVPFLGFAAGYEWLMLVSKDHQTGLETKANYGNIAWETYAGVGLRLASRVRLNGELFYNGGALQRSMLDENGRSWLEAVHVNGVGMRVGLDMIFD